MWNSFGGNGAEHESEGNAADAAVLDAAGRVDEEDEPRIHETEGVEATVDKLTREDSDYKDAEPGEDSDFKDAEPGDGAKVFSNRGAAKSIKLTRSFLANLPVVAADGFWYTKETMHQESTRALNGVRNTSCRVIACSGLMTCGVYGCLAFTIPAITLAIVVLVGRQAEQNVEEQGTVIDYSDTTLGKIMNITNTTTSP